MRNERTVSSVIIRRCDSPVIVLFNVIQRRGSSRSVIAPPLGRCAPPPLWAPAAPPLPVVYVPILVAVISFNAAAWAARTLAGPWWLSEVHACRNAKPMKEGSWPTVQVILANKRCQDGRCFTNLNTQAGSFKHSPMPATIVKRR